MGVHGEDHPLHGIAPWTQRFEIDRQRVFRQPANFPLAHELSGGALHVDLAKLQFDPFRELNSYLARRVRHGRSFRWDDRGWIGMRPCDLIGPAGQEAQTQKAKAD